MITEDYINNLAARAGIKASIATVNGYDAAIALVENARASFPMIIIENNTSGVFSAEYGGVDSFAQSIWVMCKVEERTGTTKSQASQQARELMLSLIRQIMADKDSAHEDAVALDVSQIPYFTRNTAIAAGWEVQLTFNEIINLTIYD